MEKIMSVSRPEINQVLPMEMFLHCLNWIDRKDLLSIAKVCKLWKEICENQFKDMKWAELELRRKVYQDFVYFVRPESVYSEAAFNSIISEKNFSIMQEKYVPFKYIKEKRKPNKINLFIKKLLPISEKKMSVREKKNSLFMLYNALVYEESSNMPFFFPILNFPSIWMSNLHYRRAIENFSSFNSFSYLYTKNFESLIKDTAKHQAVEKVALSRQVCENEKAFALIEDELTKWTKLTAFTLVATDHSIENKEKCVFEKLYAFFLKIPLLTLEIDGFNLNDEDCKWLSMLMKDHPGFFFCSIKDERGISNQGLKKIASTLKDIENKHFKLRIGLEKHLFIEGINDLLKTNCTSSRILVEIVDQ
jgi:hypothetical protein